MVDVNVTDIPVPAEGDDDDDPAADTNTHVVSTTWSFSWRDGEGEDILTLIKEWEANHANRDEQKGVKEFYTNNKNYYLVPLDIENICFPSLSSAASKVFEFINPSFIIKTEGSKKLIVPRSGTKLKKNNSFFFNKFEYRKEMVKLASLINRQIKKGSQQKPYQGLVFFSP